MTDTDRRKDGDQRGDLEQAVEARSDAVKRGEGAGDDSPLEDAGAEDGVSGTAGVVKNQDMAPGSPTGDG